MEAIPRVLIAQSGDLRKPPGGTGEVAPPWSFLRLKEINLVSCPLNISLFLFASLSLSLCVSVYLPLCLFASLSSCLYVPLPLFLSASVSLGLSFCLAIPRVFLFAYFVSLPLCLSGKQ